MATYIYRKIFRVIFQVAYYSVFTPSICVECSQHLGGYKHWIDCPTLKGLIKISIFMCSTQNHTWTSEAECRGKGLYYMYEEY